VRRVLAVAGCGALGLAGYFAGTSAGFSAGVARGAARADWEWARMLENGMVGPGSTARPGAGSGLDSLTLIGGC